MDAVSRERRTSRRTTSIVSIALSAVVLAVVGGIAIAQAATTITAPETIVLMGHPAKYASVNVGNKGEGPGDSFMTVTKLYDEAMTTLLGDEHVQCTVQPGNGWMLCTGAYNITGRGQIVGQGALRSTEEGAPLDVPITGGTGDFANVRGYVTHDDSTGATIITLNLLP